MGRATRYFGAAVVLLVLFLGTGAVLQSWSGQGSNRWVAAGKLQNARVGACAVPLSDGRILITGGEGAHAQGVLNGAEIFDASGAFTSAAPMLSAHADHVCAQLGNGRVLVAGGRTGGSSASNVAEIYDPERNAWSLAGAMMEARAGATASLLKSGSVLIAGGENNGTVLASLEIFDAVHNRFEPLDALMSTPRKDHAAAVLPDGRVLIAGGGNGSSPVDSVDVFNEMSGAISPIGQLSVARSGLSATVLLDGSVLLAGGASLSGDVAVAELYNPATQTFSVTTSMQTARHGHQAFRLPDNNTVLIVGGTSAGTALSAAELYVPWERAFKRIGDLGSARAGAVGAPLGRTARLMVAGGAGANSTLSGAEAVSYATLTTDRSDYLPGMTVVVGGTGWRPGETVMLVFHETNGPDADITYQAVADGAGNISNNQFAVDSHDYGVIFTLTATGLTSGFTAQTSFTDGASLNGCGNGPLAAPTTCVWQTGNLNSSKAHFLEGDSVPYRLVIDGLTPGTTHTIAIGWDTTDSGKHAIDYLTSFNRTVTDANPCDGVTGCSGTPITSAIPADPNAVAAGIAHPQIAGSFALWGGQITSTSAYSIYSGSYSKNSSTSITLTIDATSPKVVLAWGAHIATRPDWGATNTLLMVNGSSYHTHLVGVDGSGGNQDQQFTTDAVIFPGSITIVKHANPQGATPFPFTGSGPAPLPAGFSSFSLTDDGTSANTKLFGNITTFSAPYVITEQTPSGWTLDSIACIDVDTQASINPGATAGTASLSLSEGQNVQCTFNNSRLPVLTVTKAVAPTSDAGLFNLQIDSVTKAANVGNSGSTGSQIVSVGSHTVGETAGTGTTLSDYTAVIGGDCATNGSITLAVGDTKTCTITNTRKPRLTVTKTVVPSADTGKFNLQIDGATAGTGANAGNNGTTGAVTVSIGSHTVGETAGTGSTLSDYTAVIGGDCAADGSITLAAGDNKTCTITNTKGTKLTLNKVVVPSTDTGKFNLQIDGATAGTGANVGNTGTTGAVTVGVGSHTVGETAGTGASLADYITAISGDCAADGSITLAAGDSKTCTITNTRKPQLTVTKTVVPGTDTGKFNLQIDGTTAGTGADAGDHGSTGAVVSSIGSHTVGETAGTGTNLSDYTAVIGGACAADGTVTLAAGDNKTCTITNTRKPRLTVTKTVMPSTDPGKFNLQIDGSTAGTGGNVGNGGTTGAVVSDVGSHTVGETAVTGTALSDYTTVIGGDCAANGSVTLAAGDNKTCTITNTRKPKLTVTKTVVPSTDTGKFNLLVDGATAGTGANVGDSGTTDAVVFSIGSHTVGESAGTGTSLSDYTSVIGGACAADGSVTLAAGDNKTCTITNSRKPRLTVTKTLLPGTDPGKFNLLIDGAPAVTDVGNNGTTGAITTGVGSHTVGESAGTGTSLADYTTVIGGECAANGSITLAVGDNKTCTITNSRKPKLTVTKTVAPSTDTGKFNLQIDTATAAANVGNGGTTGAVVSTIGSHTVAETAGTGTNLSDYTAVIGGACAADGSVTLAAGDDKTCTITNTRITKLTVNKVVVPSTDSGKFNLQIDGITKAANVGNSGTTGAVTVSVGSHKVGETAGTGANLSDYITTINGDCAADGSITLAAGDSKTCTITNTRKPTLTVRKVTAPITDTGLFNLQIDGNTAGTGTNVGNGGTTGAVTVTIGSHTVNESAGTGTALANYAATFGGDCDPTTRSVTLAAGQNKVCTITNTRIPVLIVTKTLLPASDTATFNLQVNGVTKATGGDGTTTGPLLFATGNYTVGETAAAGTNLSDYASVISGACAANGAVTLLPGDVKTCTITNTKRGWALVKKTIAGGALTAADSFTFQLRQGASTTAAGTLLETGVANLANSGTVNFAYKLVPGQTYQLCEVVMPGWKSTLPNFWILFNASGDNSTICTDFTVGPGDHMEFDIDNTRPPGGLSRTIGFWKNWSSCTGGNQKPLLDQNLPVTVGLLDITTCPVGVAILNKSDIKSGKKMASDPGYNLAAQYVAAALNYHVGAYRCAASDALVNAAQALLVKVNFTGTGATKMSTAEATQANTLAAQLDQYNNNNFLICPP